MPEPHGRAEGTGEVEVADGRRRRGNVRRRALLDATLQVIGRDGLAAVTQRAVATEAALPPSAVYYYFPTLDDLVTAALVDANDRFLAELRALPEGKAALRALAVAVVASTHRGRVEVLAELELWMLAARRDGLRGELDRWNAGLREAAAKLTGDASTLDALVAVLNGYYWQAATSDEFGVDELEAILRHVTRPSGPV
jgi:TetR/AcrR family transcriptional regulator, regulator of biofilm formation and stress response